MYYKENSTYETTAIPRALIRQILRMAHDKLGHNGTHRTYTMLQKVVLLERFKSKCWKVYQNMLSVSEEK